jgi:hypothetical protein
LTRSFAAQNSGKKPDGKKPKRGSQDYIYLSQFHKNTRREHLRAGNIISYKAFQGFSYKDKPYLPGFLKT